MGKGRLCTKCGSYTEPADARQCANPDCRAVFCEPQPAGRCSEPGCTALASICVGGRWTCGEHFDRLRFGDTTAKGAGYETWRRAMDAYRAGNRRGTAP